MELAKDIQELKEDVNHLMHSLAATNSDLIDLIKTIEVTLKDFNNRIEVLEANQKRTLH